MLCTIVYTNLNTQYVIIDDDLNTQLVMIYAHFVMIEEWWNTQFVILNTQSVIVEWWKSSPVNEFQ